MFRDLTFRGTCRAEDGWQFKKTFYASRCRNIVDLRVSTNTHNIHTPEDIMAWVRSLCAKP